MASIESICRVIQERLKDIRDIATKIPPSYGRQDEIVSVLSNISALESSFRLKVAPLILFEKIKGPGSSSNEFSRIVTEEQIQTIIVTSARKLYDIIRSKGKPEKKMEIIAKQIENHIDSISIHNLIRQETSDYTRCTKCGDEMEPDPEKSELKCRCGYISKLDCVSFGLSHVYGQDNQKTKTGTFQPDRHFNLWMLRIQAKEKDEEIGDSNDKDNLYGEKLIKKIRDIIHRDNKVMSMVDVYTIRRILKEIRKTHLNRNTPKIIKKLTGIGPPSLPDDILCRASKMFSKVIEIHESIHSDSNPNRSFYPYYIAKILELIIPKGSPYLAILSYIYHQNFDTLSKNDEQWRRILEKIRKDFPGDLKFIPTDKYGYLQYRNLQMTSTRNA